MSRILGVDLRPSHVRLALVRSGFRSLQVQSLHEVATADHESPVHALRAALAQLGDQAAKLDAVVATVPGSQAFLQRVQFPEGARKRVDELMPFELESELPIDVTEITFGYQQLPELVEVREAPSEGTPAEETDAEVPAPGLLRFLVASARADAVLSRIAEVKEGLGHEPERIGVSATELGQLAHLWPVIGAGAAVALLDLGDKSTDLCIVKGDHVRVARTLTTGVSAFPDGAMGLVRQIKQTLAAHGATPGESKVEAIYVAGDGGALDGMLPFLEGQFSERVLPLPAFPTVPATKDAPPPAPEPKFAAAVAAAVHGAHGKGFDLRRGQLAFTRGYGVVKERAPMLGVLGALLLVSFVFAMWAQSHALSVREERLTLTLEEVTKSALGEAISDPDEATSAMDRALRDRPEDPMPYMDGFGAAVTLAKTLPKEIVHDVEQFEFSKGKLKIRGIVGSAEEAQKVAQGLEADECIENAKISKITQVINTEKERYILEADVHCPQDQGPKDPKKKPGQEAKP